MSQTTATTFACPRCGTSLHGGTLACPHCGALVYSQRLQEIAAEATRMESENPVAAAHVWQQALPLLPQDSQQYRMVYERVGALLAGSMPGQAGRTAPSVRRNDPWPLAVTKTVGSMIISIVVYTFVFRAATFGESLLFASGFVVLMLVHEMGHVFAMRFYGLHASPPIFIPFLGALINLRERPRNALEEAIVGIGGPFLGTLGAIAVYFWYVKTGYPILLLVAFFGFLLNFFNLLPVPPLDGGRITAAVTPWIWIPGLLILVGLGVRDWVRYRHLDVILILVLLYAWPRVRQTLIGRDRQSEYYKIGLRAMWAMGAAYVGLAIVLGIFYFYTYSQAKLLMPIAI